MALLSDAVAANGPIGACLTNSVPCQATPSIRNGFWMLKAVIAIVCAFVASDALALRADSSSRVDALFAELTAASAPGCAVGVTRQGELLYEKGHGMADLASSRPIEAGTVFNIASTSKQFTAFAILLLAQQRLLSLDDSILQYVPELGDYVRPVTLRHLIHHTGGLRDYSALMFLKGRTRGDVVTKRETLEAMARQRSANSPAGERFEYSNTGYFLLGIVAERVSGQSMRDFAAQHIFAVLGMHKTSVVDRYPTGIEALARGYRSTEGQFLVNESPWEQTGDGQIHTTVRDLLRWSQNFHDAGLGGSELIVQMTKPGRLDTLEGKEYAAGLFLREYRGLKVQRHGGSWAGYTSELLRFPGQHVSIAVLCNGAHLQAGRYANAIADVYLEDQFTAPVPAAPTRQRSGLATDEGETSLPRNLKAYAGVYWSPEGDVLWQVHVCKEGLFLDDGLGMHVIKSQAPGVFRAGARTLRFANDPGKGFTLRTRGVEALGFERREGTGTWQPVQGYACATG